MHNSELGVRGHDRLLTGRPAFTLIELMAVLLVISILVLVILPDLSSSHHTYRLQSAGNEIAGALRFAQSTAINTGTNHGCETDSGNNTIRCFIATGVPPYSSVNHPVRKTSYLIDFDAHAGHGGVTISANTFTSDRVIFDSLGSPDSGGAITVSLGGYSKTITVAAITGLITVSDS